MKILARSDDRILRVGQPDRCDHVLSVGSRSGQADPLDLAESASVVRVEARRSLAGDGYQHWDVLLYSLAHDEPLAHEAPALTDEPGHEELTGYIDHYLNRVGLRRSTELGGRRETLEARVEKA
jgi:hypothetical protein